MGTHGAGHGVTSGTHGGAAPTGAAFPHAAEHKTTGGILRRSSSSSSSSVSFLFLAFNFGALCSISIVY
jgi:hypothetical protein